MEGRPPAAHSRRIADSIGGNGGFWCLFSRFDTVDVTLPASIRLALAVEALRPFA